MPRASAHTQAADDAVPTLPVPFWFPFSDMLNSWLLDLWASTPSAHYSMSLSEYEAMNDELANMRTRLQAARDRERRARAAMAELELEMQGFRV